MGWGEGGYLGGAGGPEWLNEPVHSLQNGCRTQGSQSGEHDEGQHLPRRKETEFTVKWPRTERGRAQGRSETLVPTPGAQVQTLALIPAGALPESLRLRASVFLSINCEWRWLPCQLHPADLRRIRSEEAPGRWRFSSSDAHRARQILPMSEEGRGATGKE